MFNQIISVMIADDNVEFGNVLKEYLESAGDIVVKGVARDGIETVGMLKSQNPDVVILDLIMPNLDGIGVLERVSEMDPCNRPIFIVLSAVGQDSFIRKAVQLGAEYYMVKPFDVDILLKRIRQLYGEMCAGRDAAATGAPLKAVAPEGNEEKRLEIAVSDLILNLGILPNLAGYHYLREAILLTIRDQSVLSSPTRSLYPVIAEKYNATSSKVNRAIRNTLENSSGKDLLSARWGEGNANAIRQLAEKAREIISRG